MLVRIRMGVACKKESSHGHEYSSYYSVGLDRDWRRRLLWQRQVVLSLAYASLAEGGIESTMDFKSLLVGGLIVALAVVGYLYWDRQRNTVEIKLPSVTIQKP